MWNRNSPQMREFKFEQAMRERVAFEKGKETKQLIAIGDVVLTEAQARYTAAFPLYAMRSMCCCMLCPSAPLWRRCSAPMRYGGSGVAHARAVGCCRVSARCTFV